MSMLWIKLKYVVMYVLVCFCINVSMCVCVFECVHLDPSGLCVYVAHR